MYTQINLTHFPTLVSTRSGSKGQSFAFLSHFLAPLVNDIIFSFY